MLKQHRRGPNRKEINHKKPAQAYSCHELKAVLQECREPASFMAAGNNISVITDTLRNYPLCKDGFRRACVCVC